MGRIFVLITPILLLVGCATVEEASEVVRIDIERSHSFTGGKEKLASVESEDAAAHALWLEAKRDFTKTYLNSFGPGASFVSVHISKAGERYSMHSWHPVYEGKENLVVTSTGVSALGDRDREEVIANDDPAYQKARNLFDRIRAFAERK